MKQRIITAAALLTTLTIAWLLLGSIMLPYLMILVGIIAAWEWAGLLQNTRWRWLKALILLLPAWTMTQWLSVGVVFFSTLLGIMAWGIALAQVLTFTPQSKFRSDWLSLLLGMGMLNAFFVCGLYLLQSGGIVLFTLPIVWVALADTGAYFVGRQWGTHPLAANVSPKKTKEGALGGLLSALASVLFLCPWLPLAWHHALILCAITVLFSILGDLFESVLKRQKGVKDSGAILPGHGGVLDRIDGWLSAMPVFTIGWLIFLNQAM